ncbi:MAG TPA: ERAP1-like C-terminal domain-containing protein, partial [Micromonosporaceae bacterium]
ALPYEPETVVVRDVSRFLTGSVVNCFLPPSAQLSARRTIAGAYRTAMETAEPGSGRQLTAARAYLGAAGPDDVADLQGWLDDRNVPPGLEMDAELRWLVVARLSVLGAVDADRIEAEFDRDHTAQGAEHAARCHAARPDPAAKSTAWQVIMEDDSRSNRLVTAASEGFFQPEQLELTRPYVERYFDEMPAMAARRTPHVVAQIGLGGFPRYTVEPWVVEACEAMLARPDLTPVLRRIAADHMDDLRRAIAARRLEES